MTCITLTDAQLHLPELISGLKPGEVIQIVSGNRTVAKLIGEESITRQPRKPGSTIGTLKIISDDQEHLEDFKDYRS